MNFLRLGLYLCTKNDFYIYFNEFHGYLDRGHKYRRFQGLNYKFQGLVCIYSPLLGDGGFIIKYPRVSYENYAVEGGYAQSRPCDRIWMTQIKSSNYPNQYALGTVDLQIYDQIL
jgi:hypothetical protein